MKKRILKSLAQIKSVAEKTGMRGRLTLEFSGCTMSEWDSTIESITEYPRLNHIIEIAPHLNVALLISLQ